MASLQSVLKVHVENANAALVRQQLLEAYSSDDQEDDLSDHEIDDHDEVTPIAFNMQYRGASGGLTGRTVRLLKITPDSGDYKLSAWCYHRDAYRLFLLSRIVEITDIVTGEVFDDAYAFFADCGVFQPETPEAHAVRLCRDEIVLLSIVGACDGLFRPSERDEVVKHVFDRVCEPLNEGEVHRLIRSIAPDEKAFERALKNLKFSTADIKRAVWRSVRRVIDADGSVHLAEAEMATHIQKALAIA
ncbi:TerB family tellurite resistance protein [Asticcacaulis sp. EMRT-3]|uniref:tellurite resistance TerB family protein n=1 Tax=Asticcacaulis sp. EMRT-3 TaxID=3040349 RepID=UPI0024AF5FD0|nr:TerB family tellurite resistance protein [Asticcacaulis sp. EMRT-3]MDI7776313.1 TerB family tellurite resistance protein [Asticcacaulis sp. EMRT-3]